MADSDKQLTEKELQRGQRQASPQSKTYGPGPAPRTFKSALPDSEEVLRETKQQSDKKPGTGTSSGGGQGGGGA